MDLLVHETGLIVHFLPFLNSFVWNLGFIGQERAEIIRKDIFILSQIIPIMRTTIFTLIFIALL